MLFRVWGVDNKKKKKMTEKGSKKRKADEQDSTLFESSVQDLLIHLIHRIDELRDENMILHKQMDFLCKDVETMRCLLVAKTSSTNYTSLNKGVEKKKRNEEIIMSEDEDKDKENNNNNNNNNTAVRGEEPRKNLTKKRQPCENCGRWSHKKEMCWRKNPEKAPKEWQEKAEEKRKKSEERKSYEQRMDFNAKLAYATASKEEKRERLLLVVTPRRGPLLVGVEAS